MSKTFQEIISRLRDFWGSQGCVIEEPYDMEVGAGTMHPATFFGVLRKNSVKVAYVQPSRRPTDARYGVNPFRLGKHYQFQVIIKPSPKDIQQIYARSLEALGLDLTKHDLRFEEDNWEAPTLGAWGIGWQVMLDGMEITQFTYFQQSGGVELPSIPVEITYGLERITMFLNKVKSIYDIRWNDTVTYGTIRKEDEYQQSVYGFEVASVEGLKTMFTIWEREAANALSYKEPLYIPAYEACLKCSHIFNLLEARGAISAIQRVEFIRRIRSIAVKCAKAYLRALEESDE